MAKCGRGIYEVQGRKIKMECSTRSLEPLVVDGPLRQPLSDYLAGSEMNQIWEPASLVQSALHALPKPHRVSFEELYPQNRTDAMRLAVLEANAREMHAKEQLSRSPSPDRRRSHSRDLSSHSMRSTRSPLSRQPRQAPPATVPMPRRPLPGHQPLLSAVPVIFGTAPRSPSPMPIALSTMSRTPQHVARQVRQVSPHPTPAGNSMARGKENVQVLRQRSVSPSPQVPQALQAAPQRSTRVPHRMGLAELKQAFQELKHNAAAVKHELQMLQARAIDELTKSETTRAPPSEHFEHVVDEVNMPPEGSSSAPAENCDPHLVVEKASEDSIGTPNFEFASHAS